MLSVEEAARRVGRSPETVRRWIRDGRLPARTEGRRRVIDTADLDGVRDELYPIASVAVAVSVTPVGFARFRGTELVAPPLLWIEAVSAPLVEPRQQASGSGTSTATVGWASDVGSGRQCFTSRDKESGVRA